MPSRRYIVRGRVQGVWYRATLKEHASKGGFSGYVRNLSDGSVEAAVTCEDERCFDRFETMLKEGSPLSRVEAVEYEPLNAVFEDGFEIL
ncbi:MAG TPA: acylphosphatase [Sulfuricurvum sp.]|nr:acylphosphatase [Sulfuricurvum sp.]